MSEFATALIAWQRRKGRHGLPWQLSRDPYRIWISEVMLQQTQVAAVIPYYERFLREFPDVHTLAASSEDAVLRLWSGLGYYARARNLHRAARVVVEEHRGRFPASAAGLEALPGLGRSSAAAIAAFAYGERAAILDGNVKRVLARCFGVPGWPGERVVEERLWNLAESLLPAKAVARYTQALMDLGATCCSRTMPECERCPVSGLCVARREGLIDSLPAPRPRKPRPLRSVTWLVLMHARQVLLERRPSSGIWGGLWTFPEVTRGLSSVALASRFGCEVIGTRRLDWVRHGFTHFELRARPVVCHVRAPVSHAESPGRLWLDIDDAAGAAVPAPVRHLLGTLGG